MNAVNSKNLIIVSGVTGDLGKAYYNYYATQPNTQVIGITRQETAENYLHADLLNKSQTRKVIDSISFSGIEEIVLIHPVGKFKFEDKNHPMVDNNNDGIDDEIYSSNIQTFINVLKPIYHRLENRKLTICQFGSISDAYNIPYWQSYSKSKKIVRSMLQKISENSNVRALFFNLSSVLTLNESKTRPCADTTYWITPQEIVKQSMPYINKISRYQEIPIYKNNPEYTDKWFTDTDKLYERWIKDMGIVQKRN